MESERFRIYRGNNEIEIYVGQSVWSIVRRRVARLSVYDVPFYRV